MTTLTALLTGVAETAPLPPDPPPLLVSIADIARHCEVTRQAVSMWVAGQRGRGAFPAPIHAAPGPNGYRLWRWIDVLIWLDRPDSEIREAIAAWHTFLCAERVALDRVVCSYTCEQAATPTPDAATLTPEPEPEP